MPDDQNKPVIGTPEIIVPAEIRRIPTSEEKQRRRRQFTIAGVSGAFLLGLLLWGLNQYLSLRGVVHVLASRIILVCMWPIGNLLVAVLLWPLQLKRRPRIGGVLVAAVALGCALYGLERWTLKLAEQSPPTAEERLQVNVTSNLGTPPEGMRGSIKWEPEYTYILLLIDDPGPTDFDNLDMTVSFDLAIASMDQYTKFSGVSMFPDLPVRLMGGSVTTVDKSGNKLSIPAYAGEVTSSSAYRIRCEHVPRRSAIEFVAAGVVLNIPTGFSVYEPGKEYGPKRLPTLMSISGSYKVGPKLVNFANNLKLVPQ